MMLRGRGASRRLCSASTSSASERRQSATFRSSRARASGGASVLGFATNAPLTEPPNTPLSSRGRQGRRHTLESLTAAPVCCSGWFGTDRAEQGRDDQPTALPPPPRPDPGRPFRLAASRPHDGRASATRPAGHTLRPPPLPTATTNRPSPFADIYLSATEDQNPVGVRVPNNLLSSRGRGAVSIPRESLTAALVCCSGWFGTERPNKASKARLPHQGHRRDPTLCQTAQRRRPSGPSRRPQRARLSSAAGRASLRPPLPTTPTARPASFTDNDMSVIEDRNPVGGGVPNDPLSSRGRGTDSAPQKGVMRPRSAAATGSARTAPEQGRDDRTTASRPAPRLHPGRAMPPRRRTAPRDGRASAARPVGCPLRPPPPPTVPTA